MKEALESIPVINAPYGPFAYTPTNHNGFKDEGIVIVAANSLQPNGGYPRAKLG
jgi:hypothetical protein